MQDVVGWSISHKARPGFRVRALQWALGDPLHFSSCAGSLLSSAPSLPSLGHMGQHFHLFFFILLSVPFSKTPALSSQAGKQRGGPLLGTGDPQTTSIFLAYFMEKMGKRGEEIPSKSRFFSQPTNLPSSISANLLPDHWSGKRVPPVRLTLTPPLVSASDPLSVLPSSLSPGSSACLCHSQHIHSLTVIFKNHFFWPPIPL